MVEPEVWPREVVLVGPEASHLILSPGELSSRNPLIARVEGQRVLAVSDGETEVLTAGTAVKVLVRDSRKPMSLDFENVIIPILTRAGCNAAQCHGAALGQAGFKLSLFGNDPEADYLAITHELSGRRIDRAEKKMSLVLRKPSRQIPHKGGRVLPEDSPGYRALLAWAERGFPFREDPPAFRVETIEVSGSSQLLVRAWYSDGVARDVTHLAKFNSNDDAIADVSDDGAVTLKEPGETSIMVRFSGHVAAARVRKSFASAAAAGNDAKPMRKLPVKNFIDEHIGRALERLGLEASGECSDEAFLRRAWLDVTGTLPTPQEARAFLQKPDRERLVADLIERPEFDAYWGYRLDQLFGVSSKKMRKEDAQELHKWLKSRVRKPWAETARELITATGFSPPASFYHLSSDPKELTEQVGRVFLGTRWQCAQCHNHPFERFRQIDYYGMAAMFARVRVTEEGVVHLERGEVTFPKTGKDALPVFPDGSPGDLLGDRRLKLAEWVVSRPQFKQAFVNRVWAAVLGRGIVHPPDDFRASNPPSNPELLMDLSRLETLPELVSAIARSAAYQRAGPTEGNQKDLRFYSHAYVKPLEAEVLVDAIAKAAGREDLYEGHPAGTRAIDLGDFGTPSYTLDVCGRSRPGFEGSLAQELHLLNGAAVQKKLVGVTPLLLDDDEELVNELYLRAYSRFPSKLESERWIRMLQNGPRDEVAACLGIDSRKEYRTPLGRPVKLLERGTPIDAILS